jgi:hypothetical protein
MVKSSIPEGFTSPIKGQYKKTLMKRYGRRQLLKEKAGRVLIAKKIIGAEIGEDAEAEEGDEEETEEEDVDDTSALQALADNGPGDQGFDIEETGEGSTMGQTTGDGDLLGLAESSYKGEETKESRSLTTPEDDMYYIEAIKSSRVGKHVCGLVLEPLTINSVQRVSLTFLFL